jgi:hypothetical protein
MELGAAQAGAVEVRFLHRGAGQVEPVQVVPGKVALVQVAAGSGAGAARRFRGKLGEVFRGRRWGRGTIGFSLVSIFAPFPAAVSPFAGSRIAIFALAASPFDF